MRGLRDEPIEFLNYVEHSDEKTAENAKGALVKNVHKRVTKVKNDASVEVEFMTLLERDREKIEEGIKLTKKVFKLLNNGESIESIAKICNISVDMVKEIIE